VSSTKRGRFPADRGAREGACRAPARSYCRRCATCLSERAGVLSNARATWHSMPNLRDDARCAFGARGRSRGGDAHASALANRAASRSPRVFRRSSCLCANGTMGRGSRRSPVPLRRAAHLRRACCCLARPFCRSLWRSRDCLEAAGSKGLCPAMARLRPRYVLVVILEDARALSRRARRKAPCSVLEGRCRAGTDRRETLPRSACRARQTESLSHRGTTPCARIPRAR
jgi:hypothetical protein